MNQNIVCFPDEEKEEKKVGGGSSNCEIKDDMLHYLACPFHELGPVGAHEELALQPDNNVTKHFKNIFFFKKKYLAEIFVMAPNTKSSSYIMLFITLADCTITSQWF